jgi:hypothetical protein
MKKLLFILFLLLTAQQAKADTTIIYFTDLQQTPQWLTIHSCDTLEFVNTSGLSYLMYQDTSAAGSGGGITTTPDSLIGTWQQGTGYFYGMPDDPDNFVVIAHQSSPILFYITIVPPPQLSFSETICHGGSYLFDGIPRTASGTYTMTTPSPDTPCDSIITLNLTVLPAITQVTVNAEICSGNTYTLNGHTYVNPGYYPIDTLTAANGCDSVLQLHLTWTTIFPGNIYETICTGQSYLFDGEEYTEPGTYTAFLQTADGCDSIAILNLTVIPPVMSTVSATICPGESYLFGGQQLTESGTYTHTYELAGGCDSNVVLSLHVESSYLSIYQFDENTLYAASPVTVYFVWMDCTTGFVFEDETGTTFTPEENGFYAVIATENGCPDTSDCLPISAIGLTEHSDTDYVVFPVPADETVTISADPALIGSAFTVVSSAGTVVLNGRIDAAETTVEIGQLASGLYTVRIQGSKTVSRIVRE